MSPKQSTSHFTSMCWWTRIIFRPLRSTIDNNVPQQIASWNFLSTRKKDRATITAVTHCSQYSYSFTIHSQVHVRNPFRVNAHDNVIDTTGGLHVSHEDHHPRLWRSFLFWDSLRHFGQETIPCFCIVTVWTRANLLQQNGFLYLSGYNSCSVISWR